MILVVAKPLYSSPVNQYASILEYLCCAKQYLGVLQVRSLPPKDPRGEPGADYLSSLNLRKFLF